MRTELDKVVAALKEFYARETFLFEHDLGERTLAHRLAVHMERQFPDFEADCDFDRLGPRTLNMPRGSIVSIPAIPGVPGGRPNSKQSFCSDRTD